MATSEMTSGTASASGAQAGLRVKFYHPNGKGSGIAAQVELRLNRPGESGFDCFFLTMAKQKTVASRQDGERTFATFDWEQAARVKLGVTDVCECLAVLENAQPAVGAEGKGLYHASQGFNTLIGLRRGEQPGYELSVSRRDAQGQQVFKGFLGLSPSEGIGLRCALQTGLVRILERDDYMSRRGAGSENGAGAAANGPAAPRPAAAQRAA